jgi:HNH endonuclease/NUMOD4 motif
MEEIWKNINHATLEFPYQVSNLGNVRSLNYNRTGKVQNLKFRCTPYGHKMVQLVGKKIVPVSCLVLEAFVGERPSPDHIAHHLNGNGGDNTVENLAWTPIAVVNKGCFDKAFERGTYKTPYIKGHILNSGHKIVKPNPLEDRLHT